MTKYFNARLKEGEHEIIERVKETFGLSTLTDSFRKILSLANVMASDLTIEQFLKESVLRNIDDEKFRKSFPIYDAMRPVRELEEILNEKKREVDG